MTQLVFCVVYIGLEAGLGFTLQWKTCLTIIVIRISLDLLFSAFREVAIH